MTFETLEEILQLIEKPQNKLLPEMVKQHNVLNMLVNGVGVDNYLEKIEGYENDNQRVLRKKVAKSTKHIFTAILRSFDKVFTSRGGSTFIDLPEGQQAQMKDILANILYGQSLQDWMRTNWKNKFITDPNGLVYFEVEDDQTYPTYKSITSILDYKVDGIRPEYVIFKSHKEDDTGQYYRVVDDTFDRMVLVKDKSITEVTDETFINYFGFVPAVTCSDITDPNYDMKQSPIDGVTELALEYLRDMSIHSIYKFLHGYPIFWRLVSDCPVCKGTKMFNGKVCYACGGTGKKLTKDVSDIIGIEIPRGDEQMITPPAGYISPDIAAWTEQRNELDWLYAAMNFAIWGTHNRDEAKNETATGRWIDTQPVNDRLNEFADTAEGIMTEGVNAIGIFHFPNWKPAQVAIGRRFQIEPPDVLMKNYTEARIKGLPEHTLTYMLMQYYQTEFAAQPVQLAKITKLMKVEPFVHYTAFQLKDMNVPAEDYKAKLFFTEWAETLPEQSVIFEDEQKLRTELYTYIKNKNNEGSQNSGVQGLA